MCPCIFLLFSIYLFIPFYTRWSVTKHAQFLYCGFSFISQANSILHVLCWTCCHDTGKYLGHGCITMNTAWAAYYNHFLLGLICYVGSNMAMGIQIIYVDYLTFVIWWNARCVEHSYRVANFLRQNASLGQEEECVHFKIYFALKLHIIQNIIKNLSLEFSLTKARFEQWQANIIKNHSMPQNYLM